MNRAANLWNQLKKLLSDISEEERQEALDYMRVILMMPEKIRRQR